MSKSNALTLVIFIALSVVGGSLTGLLFSPGSWYAALVKPAYNPPNWLFPPVWLALYVLIGIAGARVWLNHRKGLLPKLWFAQMALNFTWPLLFFAAQRPDLAMLELIVLLLVIIVFTALAWHRERPAAWLFIPYIVWVGYAGFLNGAIWCLNRI